MSKDTDESIEMVDTSQFDIEEGPSDSADASLLRSKFDQLATPTRSRFSLGGRKKKVALILGLVVAMWLVGTMAFISGGADGVLDYYKNRVGMTGSGNPEVEGEAKAVPAVEDPPKDEEQYDDSDEPMLNEDTKGDDKDNPTVEDPPKEGADEDYDDSDERVTDPAKQEGDSKISEDKPKEEVELPTTPQSKQRVDMNAIGSLRTYSFPAYFLNPPAGSDAKDEGLYYYADRDSFVAKKLSDPEFEETILSTFTFNYDDKAYKVATFSPNYDMTWAIISSNSEKLFRHSALSFYWLYDIKENKVTPLTTDSGHDLVKLFYAKWSPKYNYVSYVRDNDLYIKSLDASVQRVTEDGSEKLLNARPDWVYEEEVLATEDALWWSDDETKVAFMKFDENDVPEYNIDFYVQTSEGGATKYPCSEKISYPKPGFENPEVSMQVYELESQKVTQVPREDSKLGDEHVIYEVFWINSNLMIKETDRESNILNVRLYDSSAKTSKVVHEVNAMKEYNGWIEKFNSPLIIPSKDKETPSGYVDTYVVEGYNHLVYFSSPSAKPVPITKGSWEVTNAPLAYNADKDIVYFHAALDPLDQNLYSVKLTGGEVTPITDDSENAFNTASFSHGSKYAYITSRDAFDMAASNLVRMEDMQVVSPMTSQTLWMASKSKYDFASRKFHKVDVDKYEDGSPVTLDVVEYLPPGFDEKKKYPLLVHYYAGPGSHTLTSDMGFDFKDAVSSSLNAVVLYIEPRGTGGAGWKMRSWANKKIGYWEPRDIVSVSKKWVDKGFIDTEKTACWGWSYGGFTTLKTLEYDAGETFKYGMAVAPVTNWLLYDSIYTERYMDKPENNKEGYEVSQIKDVESLSKVNRFLLMHGTADDNVHIQNTYSLLDLLNLKRVENYDVQVFPDSEHSIMYHNANSVVYDKLFSWLRDAFEGDYDRIGQK